MRASRWAPRHRPLPQSPAQLLPGGPLLPHLLHPLSRSQQGLASAAPLVVASKSYCDRTDKLFNGRPGDGAESKAHSRKTDPWMLNMHLANNPLKTLLWKNTSSRCGLCTKVDVGQPRACNAQPMATLDTCPARHDRERFSCAATSALQHSWRQPVALDAGAHAPALAVTDQQWALAVRG